ncbi:MAG: lipoxygenase family protein [Planctomycetota bacterium]
MTGFVRIRLGSVEDRKTVIEAQKQKYRYSYTHLSPLAVLDEIPFDNAFAAGWLATISDRVVKSLQNREALELDKIEKERHQARGNFFLRMLENIERPLLELRQFVADVLKFDERAGASATKPTSFDDFNRLFRTIQLPPIAKDFKSDAKFANYRLSGPNPVMLQRLASIDSRFPLSPEEYARVIPGDVWERALEEGRLYLTDYKILEGIETGYSPVGQKHVYAPLALFAVHPVSKALLPVAIQCRQTPAPDNPIFTPTDGHNWTIAKTIVEMADGLVHQCCTHFGKTHILIEPIAIATFRCFAPDHPIAQLLVPHFEGTFAINAAAWQHLVSDGGAVDKLFSISAKAARGLAAQELQSTHVHEMNLIQFFQDRGTDDLNALPGYAFRDDSILHWQAIDRWVNSYLDANYASDSDVTQDIELQDWALEIGSKEGGRIHFLPSDQSLTSKALLRKLLTAIIYTCSVQHAAVNFPQFELMSYAPSMPLSLYREAPKSKQGATEQDFLDCMPPLNMGELQMELGYILGNTQYTQLGKYRDDQFQGHDVSKPLAQFRDDLVEIEDEISERNKSRPTYEYLLPSAVPQSINI